MRTCGSCAQLVTSRNPGSDFDDYSESYVGTITDSIFYNAKGSVRITSYGNWSVTNSRFENLEEKPNPNSFIAFWYGNVTISDCFFANSNSLYTSGALYTDHCSSVSITNSYFYNCSSQGYGGAVTLLNDTNVSISHSVFENNHSPFGGAVASIYPHLSYIYANNVTFQSNEAYTGAAIICCDGYNLEACKTSIILASEDTITLKDNVNLFQDGIDIACQTYVNATAP